MPSTGENGRSRAALAHDLESMDMLDDVERRCLVEQALILIEEAYVHLPMKRAMHAIDPVQRLRLLRHQLEFGASNELSGASFHNELTEIFTSNRDLHTTYTLPEPYCRLTAFLPFFTEICFEGERPSYLVTKVHESFDHPTFEPGVEILHWNGVPIDRAVERNGERNAGSNRAARLACGLNALTLRPMINLLPPDESWVRVAYRTVDGRVDDVSLDWDVFSPSPGLTSVDPSELTSASAAMGYDVQTDAVHHAKRNLFATAAVRAEQRAVSEGAAVDVLDGELSTEMPTVFRARPVTTSHGTFGYIRVFTFNVRSADAFVREFLRLMDDLPDDGLILDVRGNPGGLIYASEELLQVMTPRRIEPSPFQLVSTPLTRALCDRCSGSDTPSWLDLTPWTASVRAAVRTGATYSNAFPISDPDRCNAIGQRVHGPVLLITDGLCYSATDLFAAGFRDHGIGTILGCSGNTGAGGANVWSHDLIVQLLGRSDARLEPLPYGAGINVSVRRNLRVGSLAGTPLEELGVVPDELHQMTRRDVLGGNEDLIEHAARLLSTKRRFKIALGIGERTTEGLRLTLDTENLALVDLYVGGHPADSIPVTDGRTACSLDLPGTQGALLEVRGFDEDGTLAAARKERF